MTIAELNDYDEKRFVEAVGWVCEKSPWMAKRVWRMRPFDSVEDLHAAMICAIDEARHSEQLALLRAHPHLGTRAKIGTASTAEQAGAGLNQLTPEEHARLMELNGRYKQRFKFPFIFAVKGSDKFAILENLESRLNMDYEDEFCEAIVQVRRIISFRLESLFEPTP